VIGAAGKEIAETMLMEELLHLLPSLNHLDILYIGPNTPVLNSPFEYETIDMDCYSQRLVTVLNSVSSSRM